MAKMDDFDFGGDELFPLDDDIFSSKADKPPKGVTGYLKNSVKSIGRLSIKLSKSFLPETSSLIESLKPTSTVEGNNVKEMIKNANLIVKSKMKEYTDIGKDVIKGINEDTKTAFKTGNFFLNHEMDMGFDLDFDESSFSDDFGGMDYDDIDNIATVKSAKISTKTTLKAAKATTSAIKDSGRKTTSAILGASQSQLKQNKTIFAQQMVIEEERHKNKMNLMRNMATNITKLVEQNNLSIKAQMEYSMKSLAFTQDMTSMLKEVRDAQWKATGTDPNAQFDYTDNRSSFSKIFDSGFNKGEYGKLLKDKFGMTSIGSILGMRGMLGGMGDMMKPADMIRSLIDEEVPRMIFGNVFSGKVKDNMYSFDKLMKSSLQGLNAKLGSTSRNGIKTGNDKIDSLLQQAAGFLHVPDELKTATNKFAIRDPNGAHPFDNKAHKAITEVIPGYLAQISAGITGKEQEFYDYENDRFRGVSSIQKMIKRNTDSVYEYTEGYTESRDFINNDSINKIGSVKGEVSKIFTAENIKKCNEIILRNMGKTNIIPTQSNFKYLKDPDSYERGELMKGLPFDEEENSFFFDNFINSLEEFREKRPEEFNSFVVSMGEIKSNLTSSNLGIEDRMGNFGSISAFNTIRGDERVNYEKNLLKSKIEHSKKPWMKQKLQKQLRDLQDSEDGFGTFVNDSGGDGLSSGFSFGATNDSPNSILKNIYDLLVDGVIVYPNNSMPKSIRNKFKKRRDILSSEVKEFEQREKQKELDQIERDKEAIELAKQAKETQAEKLNTMRWNIGNPLGDKIANLPGIRNFNNVLAEGFGRSTDSISNFLYGTHLDEEYQKKNFSTAQAFSKKRDSISSAFSTQKDNVGAFLGSKTKSAGDAFEKMSDEGKGIYLALKDKINESGLKTKKRKEGSYEDQELDQKEEAKEKRDNLVAESSILTANFLQKLLKDGIHFNKKGQKDLDDMSEDISDAADSGEGLGLSDAMDLFSSGGGIKGLFGKGKSMLAGTAAGKKVGTIVGIGKKVGGVAGAVGGVAGKALGGTKVGGAIKSGLSVAKGATGLAGKAASLMTKMFGGFIKNPAITKLLGPLAGKATKLIGAITKGVVTNAPRLVGRLGSFMGAAAASAGTIQIGLGVAGALKGAVEVRKNFGMGKGIKPTLGMTVSSALSGGLDGLFLGIPSLIATIQGKPNLASWIYEIIGNSSEQQAMALYHQYNSLRAKIYGVDANSLINFETKSAVSKGIRSVTSLLPFVDSNTQKDSDAMGFKSVKVFKYWKDNKYEPLENMRKEMAEDYGGLSNVDGMYGMTNESYDSKSEAYNNVMNEKQEIANMEAKTNIEMQANFRKAFLKAARDYVIQKDLAWLMFSTSEEELDARLEGKKRVGEKSKEEQAQANDPAAKELVSGKADGSSGKQPGLVEMASGSKTQSVAKAAAAATGAMTAATSTSSEIDKAVKDSTLLEGLGASSTKLINKFKDIITKLFSSKIITAMIPTKILSSISGILIKGLSKPNVINSKVIGDSTRRLLLALVPGSGIALGIAGFIKGKTKAAELFGISGKPTKGMIATASVCEAVDGALFGIPDIIAKAAYNKNLLYLVYDLVGEKTELDALKKYQVYNSKRAAIYGVDVNKLLEYEKKIDVGKNIFKAIGNMISNLFSGGSARADSRLLGFKSKKVFEFWRDKKFEPLNKLKKAIGLDFGNLKDLESIECENPDTQEKFRETVLKESQKFVNSNNLRWLTSATSEDDLDKNKTKIGNSNEDKQETANAEATNKLSIGDKLNNVLSPNSESGGSTPGSTSNYTMSNSEKDDVTRKIQQNANYSQKTTDTIANATSSVRGFYEDIVKTDTGPSSENTTSERKYPDSFYEPVISSGPNPATGKIPTNDAPAPVAFGEKGEGKGTINNNSSFEKLVSKSTEIIEKLDLLDMLVTETKRHNKVSENYYAAALELLSIISGNTGRPPVVSNEIDALTRQLSLN